MNLYWGDIHNHCHISYGYGSLDNALRLARNQLDFVMITGHAMWPDMYERNDETAFIVDFHEEGFKKLRDHWSEIRASINDANNEKLVTFLGYEMHSSLYGDHHVLSVRNDVELCYMDSPSELVDALGGPDTNIAIPHHIGYPSGYRGINWNLYDETISPVIEVFSKHGCAMSDTAPYPYYHDMGPRDDTNTIYAGLALGHHFGFAASTDHHAGYPGSYGDGRLAVFAETKDRSAIFSAMKRRQVYAVTGDHIVCNFTINDAPMGSIIEADERKIRVEVEIQYPLERMTLLKNLKPFKTLLSRGNEHEISPSGKYKLRLEMGWGPPELYDWIGELNVDEGAVLGVQPYLRGRSILSPTMAKNVAGRDEVNNLRAEVQLIDENTVTWEISTVGNTSTLHPCTSSLLFDLQGDENTRIHFKIQGRTYTYNLGELLTHGFTGEVKEYHSNAFKIHRAITAESCRYVIDTEDFAGDEAGCHQDIYHLEVYQKNGQHAFVTPIWVSPEKD